MSSIEIMYTFKTENLELVWEIEPDLDPFPEFAAKNVFTSHIYVKDRRSGEVLGESYLGECVYDDPEEFRDHIGVKKLSRKDGIEYGSYFSDMVREVCRAARQKLIEISQRPPVYVRDRSGLVLAPDRRNGVEV